MLFDSHGRIINYLRLAVTDRCNLRCFYCMPAEGIQYLPKPHLLSFEEMLRLCQLLAAMGISKVRITGGEPFLRKDLMRFLWKLSEMEGIAQIHLTTNGVLTTPHIKDLATMGIKSVNLSLDSLDPQRFKTITRTDTFPQVWETLEQLLANGIGVKTNMVVMAGKNEQDILPMLDLAKNKALSVRFIEEMPFNGSGFREQDFWSYQRILNQIKTVYPEIQPIENEANSTSINFKIPNFSGNIGIIPAFSRTFCGTCNRLRVTPTGDLKTCLYADSSLNVRDLMRNGQSNEQIQEQIREAFQNKAKDGFEAEKNRKNTVSESMTTIGG